MVMTAGRPSRAVADRARHAADGRACNAADHVAGYPLTVPVSAVPPGLANALRITLETGGAAGAS